MHSPLSKDQTKKLIIHADDAGLSCAENEATMWVLEHGIVNSYSIMMPCPWAFHMANFAKHHPQYDSGVHLTLTSEWKHYKFGPVLPAREVPSLVDQHGHFHATRAAFKSHAHPDEVKKELRAQVERALDWGVNPTHLDSHMYTLKLSAELLDVYRALGEEFNLPILLSKLLLGKGVTPTIHETDLWIDQLYVGEYSWFEGSGGLATYYDQALDNLPSGLNIMLIHPALDNAEMQSICVEHPNFGAEWRQMDFDYFTNAACAEKLKKNNIQLTTWKEVQKSLA